MPVEHKDMEIARDIMVALVAGQRPSAQFKDVVTMVSEGFITLSQAVAKARGAS
jgi:hypothetical protein